MEKRKKTTALAITLTVALLATLAIDASAQPTGKKRGRRGNYERRADIGLKVGQIAPDFTLMSPDGETETRLDSLWKEKPVVLFFGSYT